MIKALSYQSPPTLKTWLLSKWHDWFCDVIHNHLQIWKPLGWTTKRLEINIIIIFFILSPINIFTNAMCFKVDNFIRQSSSSSSSPMVATCFKVGGLTRQSNTFPSASSTERPLAKKDICHILTSIFDTKKYVDLQQNSTK